MKFRYDRDPAGQDRCRSSTIYGDILEADLVINVPIAKTTARPPDAGHEEPDGRDPGSQRASMPRGLDQCIADLNSAVKPQLTVVDAVRILMANGPTGGNLNDVKQLDTVIASADVVAADAYATSLFGMKPDDIGYIARRRNGAGDDGSGERQDRGDRGVTGSFSCRGATATGDDNFTAEDAEIAEFIIFSASSAFSAVILSRGCRGWRTDPQGCAREAAAGRTLPGRSSVLLLHFRVGQG